MSYPGFSRRKKICPDVAFVNKPSSIVMRSVHSQLSQSEATTRINSYLITYRVK